MSYTLQLEQKEFLQRLKDMDEVNVLNLTNDDKSLINAVLMFGVYSEVAKPKLERLRQRWYQDRPDDGGYEYY